MTVNLADGTGQGGHAEGDTLTGFENLWGSDHADHLIGDDGDNHLRGLAGHGSDHAERHESHRRGDRFERGRSRWRPKPTTLRCETDIRRLDEGLRAVEIAFGTRTMARCGSLSRRAVGPIALTGC